MKKNHVGIVGFGTYIPEEVETAEEISEKSGVPADVIKNKFGFYQKPVAGKDDGTMEMGVKAAKACLKNTGVDPKEIDLVISIGEEYKEYPLVTTGIYIQEKIGAINAWGIDIAQRCGTAVAAMKIAKAMMLEDDGISTVLIAGGYRNGDLIDYQNPRVSFMYNLAAGGGAILLKKNLGRNLLLESSIISDGSFAQDVGVRYGGTKYPIDAENLKKSKKSLDVFDSEHMKQGLGEVSMPNFLKVIDQSLEKSGYARKDLDYLAILHMKRSAHEFVLSELGISPEQSIYLEDFGHIGQVDQILSTELALESGKIINGSVITWVSAGIGYAWDACTIKWGS